MKENMTEFIHPSQLNTLNSFSLFRKHGLGRLKLANKFDHKNKQVWENELNKHYYACGCSEGSKGLLLFLLGSLIYIGVSFYLGERSVLTLAGSFFGITLSGAIIGKIWGLSKANNKLKRTVHMIQANWEVKGEKDIEGIICG